MEILVAVGIALALALVLLPSLGKMRDNSWTAKGIHNARQLVRGAISYAADHRGLPPQTFWVPDRTQGMSDTYWMNEVAPYVYPTLKISPGGYLLVDGLFRCPGLNGYKTHGDRWASPEWNVVDWINVSHFRPGGPTDSAVRVNTLQCDNSKTPWIVSTDRNDGTEGLGEGFQAHFEKYVPRDVWRYGGGAIVAYYDGHVEIVPEPNSSNIFKR